MRHVRQTSFVSWQWAIRRVMPARRLPGRKLPRLVFGATDRRKPGWNLDRVVEHAREWRTPPVWVTVPCASTQYESQKIAANGSLLMRFRIIDPRCTTVNKMRRMRSESVWSSRSARRNLLSPSERSTLREWELASSYAIFSGGRDNSRHVQFRSTFMALRRGSAWRKRLRGLLTGPS
jgi:hypothetical protein